MSTNATAPSHKPASSATSSGNASRGSPGKGKARAAVHDDSMGDDEDDDEDEEMEDVEEEDDDDDDEDLDEIDPGAILSHRRTRGIKVDYSSKEAIEKAGLKPETPEDDAEDSYVEKEKDD